MEQQDMRSSYQILMDAVYNEDYDAVNNLLQKGNNVNEVDHRGISVLHHAVFLKNLKIIELLIQHNAQVDIECNRGLRPLDFAVNLRRFETVKILLQYKAEVCVRNICDILEADSKNIKKLLYENVNVADTNSFGYTALHYAVKSNDLNAIRTLISRGADVNKVTETGKNTPLHFARSTECIKILLRAGAEPNVQDEYANSPLISIIMDLNGTDNFCVAIDRKEKRQMIEELIINGANCIKVIDCIQKTLYYKASLELRYCLEDVLRSIVLKDNEHYVNFDDTSL